MKYAQVDVGESYKYSNYTARNARLEGMRIYPLAKIAYLMTSSPTRYGRNLVPFTRGTYKSHNAQTGLPVIAVPGWKDVPEELDKALRELTIDDLIATGGSMPEHVIDLAAEHKANLSVEMIQVGYINDTWEHAKAVQAANEARWAKEREEKEARERAQHKSLTESAAMLEKLLGSKILVNKDSYGQYYAKLNEEDAKALADLVRLILPGAGKD